MAITTQETFPVLVMCGSDRKRRKLLQVHDPEGKYPSKALLPFLGKRVIDWQLEALHDSPYVDRIYLLGLTPEMAEFQMPVEYIPVSVDSSLLEKMLTGLEFLEKELPDLDHLVVSTSDTPGMSTRSIDQFFQALVEHPEKDLFLSAVPEDSLKGVFSDAGRVVGRFRDQAVFPGELFAMRPKVILSKQDVIQSLSSLRRDFDRSQTRIPLGPILRYLARKPVLWPALLRYQRGTLTISQAEKAVSSAFDLQAKAVIIDDPGFGMDMDLPEDYHKLERYVRERKLKS